MMEALPVPINRTELYLAKIAGEDVTIPTEPINNTEVFLARLAGADIVLPTPINTLQVWLAILCGEQYTTPPVQGAELIGVQMVRTEFLAASAGVDGITTPTPENRAEEYWAKIAEELSVHTITVKGTSLHLLHIVSGIEDFQYVYGDTEQQKYTGKNKINVPDSSNTNNGITWTIENGVIHGVGKLTATYSNAYGHADLNLPAGEYTFSIAEALPSPLKIEFSTRDNDNTRKNWSINVGQTSMTHEFTNGLAWTGVSLVGGTVDQEIDITITGVQIEPGTTATSYEPYVGGTASPNPGYPQDVHVVTGDQVVNMHGKNLFNKNNVTSGSYFRDDGTESATALWAVTDYIAITPNTAYTLSGVSGGVGVNPSRCYYDANKNFISGAKHNNNTATTFTNTSPNGAYYMRESVRVADIATTQIEKGSTATTYESNTDYSLTLGSLELCKIGDYQDYIYKSGDDWYVHKETTKYTFTGSESWVADSYGTNSWRTSGMIIVYNPDTTKTMVICDAALGVPYNKRTSYDSPRTCICYYNESSNRFWVRNTVCDTLEKIQTATTGKNVYYRGTPTDTKITDATLVSQLNALDSATLPTPEAFVTVSGNLPAPIQFTYQGKL